MSLFDMKPARKKSATKRRSTAKRGVRGVEVADTDLLDLEGLGRRRKPATKRKTTAKKAAPKRKTTAKRGVRGVDASVGIGRGKAKSTRGKAAQNKFGQIQGAVLRKAHRLGQEGKRLPSASTLYKEVVAELY